MTGGMAIAGLGTGLAVTPLTQLALDHVPTERTGMASGVLQTARPVGVRSASPSSASQCQDRWT